MPGLHPALIPNRLIEFVGEAHSSTSLDGYSANCAFGDPCENGNPWASGRNQEPPHLIWYQFHEPKFLTKIGFSSRTSEWWECRSPEKFDVIAALDANDCGDFNKNSNILLSIENAGFQRLDHAIAWEIPKNKQSFYRCIGIRIHTVIGKPGIGPICNSADSRMMASLQKMRMWERRW